MGYTAEINKEGRRITRGEGGGGGGKSYYSSKKGKDFQARNLNVSFKWLV